MAENKEYWNETTEGGNIKISEEVVASIAALAVTEVKGVHALSAGIGVDIAELLGKKSLAKGVKIKFSDGEVAVDVFLTVVYGAVISDVAREVQENVASALQSMAGLRTSSVNVNVTGIVFPEDEKTPETEG